MRRHFRAALCGGLVAVGIPSSGQAEEVLSRLPTGTVAVHGIGVDSAEGPAQGDLVLSGGSVTEARLIALPGPGGLPSTVTVALDGIAVEETPEDLGGARVWALDPARYALHLPGPLVVDECCDDPPGDAGGATIAGFVLVLVEHGRPGPRRGLSVEVAPDCTFDLDPLPFATKGWFGLGFSAPLEGVAVTFAGAAVSSTAGGADDGPAFTLGEGRWRQGEATGLDGDLLDATPAGRADDELYGVSGAAGALTLDPCPGVALRYAVHTLDLDGDGLVDDADRCVDVDRDGDGFADGLLPRAGCALAPRLDCDDDDDGAHPDATDLPGDGIDQDCDGFDRCDRDRDGFLDADDPACAGDDCDDRDRRAFPGAADPAGDGIDQDCDGADDCDVDGDGFASRLCGGGDCADDDPARNPEATEIPADFIDQDCDGDDGCDEDRDGHTNPACGGADCDDADPSVHRGVPEVPGDGIDQDCDGSDADGDSGDPAGEGGGCGRGGAALLGLPFILLFRRARRKNEHGL